MPVIDISNLRLYSFFFSFGNIQTVKRPSNCFFVTCPVAQIATDSRNCRFLSYSQLKSVILKADNLSTSKQVPHL